MQKRERVQRSVFVIALAVAGFGYLVRAATDADGQITGTVTDEVTGLPLSGVNVRAYNPSTGASVSVSSNGSGFYALALQPATYILDTSNGLGYVNETYNDITCFGVCSSAGAEGVTVNAGTTTANVNFALRLGGRVTGEFSSGGALVENLWMALLNTNGAFLTSSSTSTSSGTFQLDSVPAGTYYGLARNRDGFTETLSGDVPCPGLDFTFSTQVACPTWLGDSFVVQAGATTTVNFSVQRGARIAGHVADSSGTAQSNAFVRVYTPNRVFMTSASTNASGNYVTEAGLPSGQYVVQVIKSPYVPQMHDGIDCADPCRSELGTPLDVEQGVDRTGVDFTLNTAGTITGQILADGNGAAIPNFWIDLFDANGAHLQRRASTSTSAVSFVFAQLPPGSYHLIAGAPGWNTERYDNQPCAGNCQVTAGEAIVVTAGAATSGISFGLSPGHAPDLAATTVGNVALTVSPGGSMTLTNSVRNIGGATAGSSSIRFYLSADGFTGADVLLTGTRRVSELAAGAVSQGESRLTVPLSTPLGLYRVLACADDLRKVAENDERNNCVPSTARVFVNWPDLIVPGPIDPALSVVPGSKFSWIGTVRNQGLAQAAQSTTGLYLSSDDEKDPGDLLIAKITFGIVDPRQALTVAKSVTIPAITPLGSYQLLVCADDRTKVLEGDEANNCTAKMTIDVTLSDLFVTGLDSPPPTAKGGAKFTVNESVMNGGAAKAGAFKNAYYLSPTPIKGAGAIVLNGKRSIQPLAPGATSAASVRLTIPPGTATGTYHLLACADEPPRIAEMDELNNCFAAATTLQIIP